MRYRKLAWGAAAGALALCLVPACGGSDDDDVIIVKKDAGKDSGSGGKDAGKDSSSGGSAGESGTAGAAGGGGAAGAAGGGGTAGSGDGGSAGGGGTGGTKPDASTGGGGGTGGTDAGKCEDNATNEPNNTEATAASASPAACNGGDKELSGVIAGADADWYDYSGGGGLTCAVEAPTVKVDHPSLRGCVFAKCNTGTGTVTCAQGATSTSPDGFKGCCAGGGNDAEASVSCNDLLDKSVTIHMRVDQSAASPAACLAYKLTYSL